MKKISDKVDNPVEVRLKKVFNRRQEMYEDRKK